jgi:hypothetical protein
MQYIIAGTGSQRTMSFSIFITREIRENFEKKFKFLSITYSYAKILVILQRYIIMLLKATTSTKYYVKNWFIC